MAAQVEQINPAILKQCREQLSIPLEKVTVPNISEMEEGTKKPTFRQLDRLAKLYAVPRWVFIRDELPPQFNFENHIPGFRKVRDLAIGVDSKATSQVQKIVPRLEAFRTLVLELDRDMNREISSFTPPSIRDKSEEEIAQAIREWLGCTANETFDFKQWKECVEDKGVFIFLTSKFVDWSHADRELFRGLSLHHDTLPIIVINDSDQYKAQSFTLFHELAHLLRGDSLADGWGEEEDEVERWCDRIAGDVIMPAPLLTRGSKDVSSLKKLAQSLSVSDYACLVKQRDMNLISFQLYEEFKQKLKEEWKENQKRSKKSKGGPPRKRAKEIRKQYGKYSGIILQGYSEKELNLHKVMEIFNLKKAKHVFELMGGEL